MTLGESISGGVQEAQRPKQGLDAEQNAHPSPSDRGGSSVATKSYVGCAPALNSRPASHALVLQGDCREVLRTLQPNSIHCCVTSPPYWALRDYGTDPLIWGGESTCDHEWVQSRKPRGAKPDRANHGHDQNGSGMFSNDLPRGSHASKSQRGKAVSFGEWCGKCNAWRGHLGLEPTPELYIEHIVEIFREVRRVLRDDGSLWLNIGDTFCTGAGVATVPGGGEQGEKWLEQSGGRTHTTPNRSVPPGLKAKDLVMIPARVALALQADGWYLRQDVIWSKTNPTPESAKDRPATSHEHIFFLTKSEDYFYDNEAVKEPVSGTAHARGNGLNPKANVPSAWSQSDDRAMKGRYPRPKQNASFSAAVSGGMVSKRNRRSVWTFPTQAYRKAHFATFPERLVEPCVMAGTSERGCCARCGAPWVRIVKNGQPDLEWQRKCGGDAKGRYDGKATKNFAGAKAQNASAVKARILAGMVEKVTVGWRPTCVCSTENHFKTPESTANELFHVERTPVDPLPCIVLDPFGGSGRTAQVAKRLGRHAVVIELKPDYVDQINQNLAGDSGQSISKRRRKTGKLRPAADLCETPSPTSGTSSNDAQAPSQKQSDPGPSDSSGVTIEVAPSAEPVSSGNQGVSSRPRRRRRSSTPTTTSTESGCSAGAQAAVTSGVPHV